MILVTGATSQLGEVIVQKLSENNIKVKCFIRETSNIKRLKLKNVEFVYGNYNDKNSIKNALEDVDYLIHIGGIWYEHDFLSILENRNDFKKAVFVGSTSRFQKINSEDSKELELVRKMENSESEINASKINTVIIRPTMLYGIDKDKNIFNLINFMSKYHCFPIIGKGIGKKQPVYVGDVADAVISVLFNDKIIKNEYNIPGAEPILYKNMISAIKKNLNTPVLVFQIPVWLAKLGFKIYKLLNKKTIVNEAMINRVNKDFLFDYEKAKQDFNYKPLTFEQGIIKQVNFLKKNKKLV
jgi:nucleoside-diphosphate-sugar epimerase